MIRKVVILALTLFLLFNNQAFATIDIPAGNYGWTLGKYDSKTKTFSPSTTSIFQWDISTGKSMFVRTIGPTSVWVDGAREGTIVSFVDKNSSVDNGYPMVEKSQWNAWITLFGGGSNSAFVLKNLQSWYFDYNGKTFANLSQLAELSGGRGLSYSVTEGLLIYGKSTGPTASITPTRYSCKVGESITFNLSATNKALSYHFVDMTFKDDKGNTYINNKRYLSDVATDSVKKTFTAPGNYLFTLTVNDGVFRYTTKQMLISVSNNPVDPVQPPDPLPEAPPEPPAAENLPPTAVYSWPSTCYEGDTVNVSESSFDLDGQVVSRSWAFAPPFVGTSSLGKGGGTISFNNIGTYNMTLTVTDDDGATDAVTHSIEVKPPVPQAVITYGGALKENRRVVLDSSNSISGTKYPIDHAKDEWTITAVYGGTASDIKLGTRTGANQDVLFKKAGTYRIGLKVYNSKYASEWAYKDLVISPDTAPVANFFKSAIAFRNPAVNNYAYVTLNDRTFSFDGDFISQRTWKYKFDTDNDGSFLDEAWVVLDSGNNTKVTFKANHVGKYLFELEVIEGFGQETIPAFIVDADYRRGDTTTKPQADKITDVQNIAPVTSFTAALKPKVDIVFSQGFLTDYANRFPQMVNNLDTILGPKLASKGIDYAFYNTDNRAVQIYDVSKSFYNLAYTYEQFPVTLSYDLGTSISKDDISQFNIFAFGNNMKLYVSNDNVNWYYVRNVVSAPYSTINWNYCDSIDKFSIPIPNFRYTKLTFDYSGNGSFYETYNQHIVVRGGYEIVSTPSQTIRSLSSNGELLIDIGKLVDTANINSLNVDVLFKNVPYYMTNFSIAVSPDNTNWTPVNTFLFYKTLSGPDNVNKNYGFDKSQITIPSFRYVKIYPNGLSDTLDYYITGKVSVLLNKGGENIRAFNHVSSSSTPYWIVQDMGKTISNSQVLCLNVTVPQNQGRDWGVFFSNDGINWGDAAFSNPRASGSQISISKPGLALPSTFRYIGISFFGGSAYTDIITNLSLLTPPRATLADITSQANTPFRTGAVKYVVSLAEEPYIDASSTNYTNAANALNNNNAFFVAFTNTTSSSSVQQLTSQLTKYSTFITETDLTTTLSKLADYINSTAVSTPLSGPMYVLLGQSLSFNPTYSDYENDPKVTDNWYYFHNPGFLDNNSGLSFYHNKTISGPVAALDKVGKYDVQYKAQDDPANTDLRFLNYRMWSDPAPTAIIVHRKPIADFSVQAGTVNVTDLSYDPDFQFRRPDKGVVQWLWKWRPVASSTWTNGKPSGIMALGTYVVHLEVKDVYGAWSDPVEKTIIVTTLQRPPVADFTWSPTLIYEGDTVTLNNLSTDPDGDPLTYLWTVFNPLGGTTTFTTKNGTIANVLPGTYWVTLRATDPGGMSDAVTKFFVVNPLGLWGSVNHTPEWNAKRISFNQKNTGTDDSPRAYNVFWAGEAFVLQANTTDTTTSTTKAQTVTATFIDRGITINLSPNASRTTWTGKMSEDDFETIADGTYDFRFVATYSNGVAKTVNVPIEISGTWLNYYKFHRSW